ncbi:RNA 2',3'-cyclic phosphodiesterase [Thermaurantiacus sp.]
MRLFVALRPPPAVRRALLGLMGGVPDARWQSDAQLHLTLAFVGECDRHLAQQIAFALSRIDDPAFTAELGAFGSFATPRGNVHTLWIGAGPAAPLARLAASVSRALLPLGVPLPERRFTPHITLARFGARGVPPASIARFLTHHPPPALSFPVRRFHLMESRLGGEGAHYESLAEFPLKESSADQHPH